MLCVPSLISEGGGSDDPISSEGNYLRKNSENWEANRAGGGRRRLCDRTSLDFIFLWEEEGGEEGEGRKENIWEEHCAGTAPAFAAMPSQEGHLCSAPACILFPIALHPHVYSSACSPYLCAHSHTA